MTATQLRQKAKRTIDELSGSRLRFVTEFLTYVQWHQTDKATRELIEVPGFLESFARGVGDVRAGRVKQWRKVRRDV